MNTQQTIPPLKKSKAIINQFMTELMYTQERAKPAAMLTVDIILTQAADDPRFDFEYWNQVQNELKNL